MDLKHYAETHFMLEKKAIEIKKIFGLEDNTIEDIYLDINNDTILFHIETYISIGCGDTEYAGLTFELDEMNNDLEYFKTKYKEKLEKEEQAKILAKKNKVILKRKEVADRKEKNEERDKAEYERLKLKYK